VIGTTLADEEELQVGQTITISEEKFHVAGVFESAEDNENGMVIMLLDDAQRVFGKAGWITGCTVNVKDTSAEGIAAVCAAIEGPIAEKYGLKGKIRAKSRLYANPPRMPSVGEKAPDDQSPRSLTYGSAAMMVIQKFSTSDKVLSGSLAVHDDAWVADVKSPQTLRLFERTQPCSEDCTVFYRTKLRTEGFRGDVYLEMWCRFPGWGEVFSRGLYNMLRGSTGWVSCETPFFLKKGERPDLIRLNVVAQGTGVVKVKDVELLRTWFSSGDERPLRPARAPMDGAEKMGTAKLSFEAHLPKRVTVESYGVSEKPAPPATEAERAIARLVLVFREDRLRRAIPGVLANAGSRTLIVTTGPAVVVPDGAPPAIDRSFLELPGRPAVKAEYTPDGTKELFVYRAEGGLTSYRPDGRVVLAVDDVLSAIIPGTSPELSVVSHVAQVVALGRQATLSLPRPLTPVQHYDQLVEVDRSLPEGTPLFKEGKLAGLVLLGSRFLGETSNKSFVVPASRIAALCSRLEAGNVPTVDSAQAAPARAAPVASR